MIKSPKKGFFSALSRKQSFRTMDLWEAQSCTFGSCCFSCLSCRGSWSRAVWSLFSFFQVLSCLWLRICSIVMETWRPYIGSLKRKITPQVIVSSLFKKLLRSVCFGFSLPSKLSILNRKLYFFCCCWIFLWPVCCSGIKLLLSVSSWWCSEAMLLTVSKGWWGGIECGIVVGWPPCCLLLCLVWMQWFSISVPSIETEAWKECDLRVSSRKDWDHKLKEEVGSSGDVSPFMTVWLSWITHNEF